MGKQIQADFVQGECVKPYAKPCKSRKNTRPRRHKKRSGGAWQKPQYRVQGCYLTDESVVKIPHSGANAQLKYNSGFEISYKGCYLSFVSFIIFFFFFFYFYLTKRSSVAWPRENCARLTLGPQKPWP